MKKFLSVALVAIILCSFVAMGSAIPDKNGPVVKTAYGEVEGKTEDGIQKYFGVPFAKPPVGELRFAPPQPTEPWEDVLTCTEYKNSAVQTEQAQKEGLTYGEDCLYLNIWAPEKGEKLPVYVFIHGGAYVSGSPSDPLYDGTAFAKDGIIQVNVTYRMNALGFMASEELEEEYGSSGNMGTLDQIAALEWVQENIAAFGGDPQNVTIGGESAGAFSVSNLIESPLAEGLFKRAIMESGNLLGQSIIMPLATGEKEQAYDLGERFMEEVGASTLKDLRSMDAQEIAEASLFSMNVIEPYPYCFWPIFDGKVIPKDPYTAAIKGNINDVDILAGFNTDEGEGFVPEGVTEQQYIDYVRSIFGEKADAVLERFPVDAEHTPTDRARNIFKTGLRVGMEIFADALSSRGKNVYYYNYDYIPQSMAEKGQGAIHALELRFVFQQPPDDSQESKKMADSIHTRWANFIKTGNPNKGEDVDVEWLKYTPEEKETLILDKDTRMAELPEREDEAFFRELLFGEK